MTGISGSINTTQDVELQVIANFNKMKSISTDNELIRTAIRNSDLVELDATGTKIRRTKSVPAAKNVDANTVYTVSSGSVLCAWLLTLQQEFFPPNSTHDTLKQLFSVCGNVVYVSMPRNNDQERYATCTANWLVFELAYMAHTHK